MSSSPKYHIHLNAFLPSGQYAADGKTQIHVLYEAPTDITYEGEPNCSWVPLNDAAVEAQRKMLQALIARQDETIKMLDPKVKSMGMHLQKLAGFKRQLADLKVGDAPEAGPAPTSTDTMSEAQKTVPASPGMALKGNRPSDSPNRR